MIRHLPCIGVRYGGDLVCWCMTFPYGAFGMLHTVESHTHQNLAQAAVRKLVDRWLSHNAGCLPFTYISSEMDEVQLFVSLGFTRIGDQTCSCIIRDEELR